jgi:DNA polymerase I-like protein with 3'-5' exonuclease and polymerase domains
LVKHKRFGRSRAGKAHWHNDQIPLITPDSDWEALPQSEWIDFNDCTYLGVDTETDDPNLEHDGPGFIRGDAKVTGISLGDEHGRRIYLPIGHAEGNVDKGKALEYVQYQLRRPGLVKVGANILYDIEALWSVGVNVPGDYRDIQVAEPLLDEDRSGGYSLDALAKDYLNKSKDERLLKEAGAAYGGGKISAKKLGSIMPAKYWGPYAEEDATLPVEIFLKQLPRIKEEELEGIFDLETELTQVLWHMRRVGVRVDLEEAERVAREARAHEDIVYQKLEAIARYEFNPFSSQDVGKIFSEHFGIDSPTTKAGNDSITNEWLQELGDVDTDTKQPSGEGNEFAAGLYELRRVNKMRKDFIEGAILQRNVNGRLHCQWHQLREYDEEGKRTRGTRSGRIASSRPNLTQVPARDPVWGKRVRRLFIADHGKPWRKFDYSQQEPRFLLHFAFLMDQLPRHMGGRPMPGAAEAVAKWIANPALDYHQMTADLIYERTGQKMQRRPAKDINLGGSYGMGKAKLRKKLKVDAETADALLKAYHEGVPYVRGMSESCMERVREKGYIRTILGRRRRFNLWARKKRWDDSDHGYYGRTWKSYEEAVEECGEGNVERDSLHKALNALVQGSAGDQMKKTLVLLHREGLTPQIQVYDELDGSWETDEEVRRIRYVMETSIPLKVPHLVEPETGPSWGELEEWLDKAA